MLFVGVAIGLAVWVVIPSPSQQRVMAVHGRPQSGRDLVALMSDRRRRWAPTSSERLAAALRTLSSELRAGSTPGEALIRAAGSPPIWPNAIAASRFGESVDRGFMSDAEKNPAIAPALRQLAACWHVGVTRGSGLAVSVERLVLSLRAQQDLTRTLRNELAAPRATSRMLAFLPVVGVVMGYLLGADPVAWFLGSSVGVLVLAIAVALTVAGSVWTRRIVQRVERGLV